MNTIIKDLGKHTLTAIVSVVLTGATAYMALGQDLIEMKTNAAPIQVVMDLQIKVTNLVSKLETANKTAEDIKDETKELRKDVKQEHKQLKDELNRYMIQQSRISGQLELLLDRLAPVQ